MENDRKNSDRIYRVPIIVDDGTILPANAKSEDFAIWYIGGKLRKVYLVPASKEVYDIYVHPIEAEKKKVQRATERANVKGEAYALPVSLDQFIKDGGDISSPVDDFERSDQRFVIEYAVSLVAKNNRRQGEVLKLYLEGYSEEELGILYKCSQRYISQMLNEAIKAFKKYLND